MIHTFGSGTKLRTALALMVVVSAISVSAAPPAANAICCQAPPINNVYAFGGNSYGQLGINTPGSYMHATPAQVPGITTAKQVAAGFRHSVLLRTDGTVIDWGDNEFFQLGDGNAGGYGSTTPLTVPNLNGITRIAAGGDHTLALRSDATVWAWGDNDRGQSGDGTMNDCSPYPVQVHNLTGIVNIAAGSDFSLALSNTGVVYAWGANDYGQMGTAASSVDHPLPFAVPVLTGITAIAAGGAFALAVRNDGTVWAWGYNDVGQLGDGTTTIHTNAVPTQVLGITGAVAVSAGASFGMALGSDGSV